MEEIVFCAVVITHNRLQVLQSSGNMQFNVAFIELDSGTNVDNQNWSRILFFDDENDIFSNTEPA